jgi:hypothetical protein
MNAVRLAVRVLAVAALTASAALAGCSDKKITIRQYPVFYTPQLKTVAVMSFSTQVPDRSAGTILADGLAAGLQSTGTYTVYNHNHLDSLLRERDIRIAMGDDAAATAQQVGKLGNVQALLVGTVTSYGATTRTEHRREPQTAYDRQGNPRFLGYREYDYTRNEATVGVTAALLRVPEGTPIHAVSVPVVGQEASEGSPPGMDPRTCLASATNRAIRLLIQEFAVTSRQIALKPSRDFRTASALYDNKWAFTTKFRQTDEKMYVVASLPAECDRNRFRVTIVRKDQRVELAAVDVVWSRQFAGRGYEFSPRTIAAAGGGPGDYTAKFYSGPEPVMTCDFRLLAGP